MSLLLGWSAFDGWPEHVGVEISNIDNAKKKNMKFLD